MIMWLVIVKLSTASFFSPYGIKKKVTQSEKQLYDIKFIHFNSFIFYFILMYNIFLSNLIFPTRSNPGINKIDLNKILSILFAWLMKFNFLSLTTFFKSVFNFFSSVYSIVLLLLRISSWKPINFSSIYFINVCPTQNFWIYHCI